MACLEYLFSHKKARYYAGFFVAVYWLDFTPLGGPDKYSL